MKQFFIIGFLSLFFISCNSSEVTNSNIEKNESVNIQQDLQTYNIGFYNVENLFDTIDDPKTEDEWFLPTSETEWNSEKYIKKLADLSKVIDAMNSETGGPDIIGLCEVENYQVVKDLASKPVLKDNHYKVIHFDSPDARGIDVAALIILLNLNYWKANPYYCLLPMMKVTEREIFYTVNLKLLIPKIFYTYM